jgi:hypothetical protein
MKAIDNKFVSKQANPLMSSCVSACKETYHSALIHLTSNDDEVCGGSNQSEKPSVVTLQDC